jgi:Spy/CpxP family protein refolding chaperone
VKQFQVKLKQGEKMRKSLSDLVLTSEQKTKIQEIFKAARAKRQEQHQNNPQ